MARKREVSRTGWYFLGIVILFYIVIYFLKPESIMPSFEFFVSIIKKIWWIFILVFVLLVFVNYFITAKSVVKYFGKQSGITGWFAAIVGGIISTGPIYMWYPLLNDLQKKGMRNGLIAAFLYNRAVKPALIPLLIFYFGLMFTIILTVVMIVMSVVQGFVVEKLIEVKE